MKYSLAEFKRLAQQGNMYLMLVERYGVPEESLPPDLQGVRPVVSVNSTGIILANQYDHRTVLTLERSSLVDIDDKYISIYDPLVREPTPEEHKLLEEAYNYANSKSGTPDNIKYWLRMKYLEGKEALYLMGRKQKGKPYLSAWYNRNKLCIKDARYKGNRILKYEYGFFEYSGK